MDNSDRRLQERYSLELQTKLSADEDCDGRPVREELTATNISSGGAFLTTSIKIPLATKVHLDFLVDFNQLRKLRFILSLDTLKRLSGQKVWVKATGVVIRIEHNGFAIIFDKDYQLTPMDSEPHT